MRLLVHVHTHTHTHTHTNTNTNTFTFRSYSNSRVLQFFLSHSRSVVLQYPTTGIQATTIYFTNQPITESKLRMYQILVRPVVTYACETWVLKENTKLKLQVFERKVRIIHGPTKENDGTWRIKSNEELNRLIGNKNIINHIKAQILACLDMYIECQIIAW